MQQSQLNKQIQITQKEEAIFKTILDFRNQTNLKSILRVAGGWVRDKLMGKESHDIDIAIDDMSGEQFVLKMKEYLESQHVKVSGFGVTRLNPQQSKHLETACIKILDQSIDFVNLRGETYTDDSRTPQIVIGTPVQDAFRRDLTINSLFYNLNSNEVEDFTQMGLQDLENGVIRTPLAPFETFKDDPLRILRTFRFATRFNFKIVDNIYEAIAQEEIKLALQKKVSRERIGIEIDWMLRFPRCLQGLKHYHELGLWNIIFELPNVNQHQCSVKLEDQGKFHLKSYEYLQKCHSQLNLLGNTHLGFDTEELFYYYLNLSIICLPYSKITYKQKKNVLSSVDFIVSESLKMPRKQTEDILNVCRLVDSINSLKKEDLNQNFRRIGILDYNQVQFLQEARNLWELVLFLDFCQESIDNPQNTFLLTQQFSQFIYEKNLQFFYDLKPLIDGNEIKTIWKVDGKFIKDIKQNILIWQAMNPYGTKEDILKVIETNKEQFTKN